MSRVLRAILGCIGVLVLPEQVTVAKANEAFDETGGLKDAKTRGAVEKLARRVVKVTAALKEV